jgi:NodT family efflux transporter outer membrane factor (OMF) lipoprotein
MNVVETRFNKVQTVVLLALLLGACVSNEQKPLPMPVLPERVAAREVMPASLVAPNSPGILKIDRWWSGFGNEELNRLVEKGLVSSPDIRIAETRVMQAKARSEQARAGSYPSVTGSLGRSQQAPYDSDTGVGDPVKVYQGVLKGNFRLDVWGEQSAIERSAELRVTQAEFDKANTQRIVTANIASAYFSYMVLNDRLRLSREIDRVLSRMHTVVDGRYRTGDATVLEFEQQRSGLFAFRASIPVIEQEREELGARILTMAGAVPGEMALPDDGLAMLSLPTIQQEVPTSVVFGRPDVRAVEARLHAAGADIDLARARLLPAVDLSASIGLGSKTMASLLSPGAFFWGTVGNVVGALFDNGRRKNEIVFSEAVKAEVAETYLRTVYQSTREIENALNGVLNGDSHVRSRAVAAEATERAWKVVTKAYEYGAADIRTLLDAERAHYRYQEEYLRAQADQFRSLVTFYQALGGGVLENITNVALN